jgi:hyperosmotically inducible periplasmic protein
MGKRILTAIGTATLMVALGALPARAQSSATPDRDRPSASDRAKDKADQTGNKVEDAWILTKIKAKFVGEDALKDSNIDVDVQHGIVTLKGTVASAAGRRRAAAIVKDTDGVVSVKDRLVIGMAKNKTDETVGTAGRAATAKADTGAATHDAKAQASETAQDTKRATKHAAKEVKESAKDVGRATKDATGTAGEAVTDSWITTKVKASFVGVDALDGSNIDVDTNDHIVTLKGTVPSATAKTRALALTKRVKGVTKVNDELAIRK